MASPTLTTETIERSESSGSYEAISWTNNESADAYMEILLDAEKVKAVGHSVLLVNTKEAGTLLVTNFRLIFVSEGTTNIIALGTIPLATIENFSISEGSAPQQSDKTTSPCLLQVFGKDMRIIVFNFSPHMRTKQRRLIFDELLRCTKPAAIQDMYAFSSGTEKYMITNPKVSLLNEYFRLLRKSSYHATISMVEDGSFTLSNELWRISGVNSKYTICESYPFALLVPKGITDEVLQASKFRSHNRLPVISWCHPETGAVLARSSQPLVSLVRNTRSKTDEKLVCALSTLPGTEGKLRKLYIVDARPKKNAYANGATWLGGGSESSSNYVQSEIVFLRIDNIYKMRKSLARLRDYLDIHGTTSSDGMSSFLRHGFWTLTGGNLSSMSASVSTLRESGWLVHVQTILTGAAWIAARIALESATVLVHCSDGWDRTSQLVSLANLLLDPYYRTFEGFQALVEKDWLAFGHKFSDRMGMGMPTIHDESSPIFLQWVDCISQLLRMYPSAFEYSADFLVDFLDCVLSCRFGNFLCNSEKERYTNSVFEKCGCLWKYLADLRAPEGTSHRHYNTFYDPAKQNGPLLPPEAALVPTIWPQFHLRWACPSEFQAGEVEAQCRAMSMKLSKLQMEKDDAERKANELMTQVTFSTSELGNERPCSNSNANSGDGNKTSLTKTPPRLAYVLDRVLDDHNEEPELSVTLKTDQANDPPSGPSS